MKDAESQKVYFDAPNWGEEAKQIHEGEHREVRFPADMLRSKQLARMIVFSSKELINKFSL